MAKSPKYSFIMPVYNGENFLHRSLNSILEQDFQDFEIIVIDDGSVDNSFEVCHKYVQENDKIRLFRQENKGVSSARNTGIAKSQGQFLFFIDADDSLYDSKVLSEINKFIVQHENCDLFQFQSFTCCKEKFTPIKNIDLNTALDIRVYSKLKIARGEVWNYVFKKDIITTNNLSFTEGLRISEDQAFVYSYFAYCRKIGVSSTYCYLYHNDNADSATKKMYSFRDLEDHIIATQAIISHLDKNRCSYRFLCERVAMMQMYLLNICAQLNSYDVNYVQRNVHANFHFLRNNKGWLLLAMKKNFSLSILLYKMIHFGRV